MKKHLTKRDYRILKFLWKWKLMTTTGIHLPFFRNATIESTYRHLWRLKKLGYLTLNSIQNSERWVWSLSQKGYTAIKTTLPPLRQDGYKSEHKYHDFICSAIHLGAWIRHPPKGAKSCSEQQLRRYDYFILEEGIPIEKDDDGMEGHRPDGYWIFPQDGKEIFIALEVEISPKKSSKYYRPAFFYSRHRQIQRVIWVVNSIALAKRIYAVFKKAEPEAIHLHNFLLTRDLLKHGWAATIIGGTDRGKRLQEVVKQNVQQTCQKCDTLKILDTRKNPTNAKSLKVEQKPQERY